MLVATYIRPYEDSTKEHCAKCKKPIHLCTHLHYGDNTNYGYAYGTGKIRAMYNRASKT